MTRVLTMALLIVMVISLLPVAALAAVEPGTLPSGTSAPGINATYFIFDKIDVKISAPNTIIAGGVEHLGDGTKKIVFKPDTFIAYDDEYYDLEGIHFMPMPALDYQSNFTAAEWASYMEEYQKDYENWQKSYVSNSKTSVTIPPIPDAADYADTEKFKAAIKDWYLTYSEMVFVFYGAHQHKYSCWIPDNNNHWTKCLVCGENFLLMNWHYDHNEDDWCDVCGHEIIYYDIKVKEADGVKITVDGDRDMTAPYRDWIEVSVEAEEGYKVTDVRVWKIRENGTKDQITRHIVKRGSEYKFEMQNFDCEIVATVVKK